MSVFLTSVCELPTAEFGTWWVLNNYLLNGYIYPHAYGQHATLSRPRSYKGIPNM